MFGISNLAIYGIIAVVITAVVGGGYLWLDHQISGRDKIIQEQTAKIAAQQIDLDRVQQAYTSAQTTIAKQAKSLKESQEQAARINNQML